MANPNNLLRPPILPGPANAAEAAGLTRSQIESIVSSMLRRECREVINSVLNPNTDPSLETDQIINEDQMGNLSEMDKVPDVVKSLREFSGQPGEFSSWKKSVERILKIYENQKGTAKYYGILNVIRNKIVGQADIALESYSTPLNWERISRCLTLHYADKRDLGTLEYQMTCLIQGNGSIQGFYQSVYRHLSLILNKISSMEMSTEAMNILVNSYRDKALDTFVRGLRGDLPRLLSMREPADLPEALHLCLKLENINYRTQYANNSNNNTSRRIQGSILPPVPSRQALNPRAPGFTPKRNFYPELTYYQQQDFPANNYRPHQTFRPQNQQQTFPVNNHQPHQTFYPQNRQQLPPKPQPRPEPMDVDQSIQSRAVNYQNRPSPRPQLQKRPNSQQVNIPNKQQRTYHTQSSGSPRNTNDYDNYNKAINEVDSNQEQALIDYMGTECHNSNTPIASQETDLLIEEDHYDRNFLGM